MTAIAAPSAASALATAAPIPLDAPVTIATLPSIFSDKCVSRSNWISIARALHAISLSAAESISLVAEETVSRYEPSESLNKSCFSR
jgi:hypothetical protein